MVNKIKVKKLICKQCGHEWIPRKEKVYQCPNPKCQKFTWDEEKEDVKG